ncbi:hypothetical protein BVX93_01695 [bacterium B13(2017)]|nr:hypothetical protein BVX93_01695 [bacterium B13(2017)]
MNSETNSDNNEGEMYLAEGKARLFDKLALNILYAKQTEGFSSLSSSKLNGQEKFSGKLEYLINDNGKIGVAYFEQDSDNEKLSITNLGGTWANEYLDIKLEYQYQDTNDILIREWNYFDVTPKAKELLGTKIGLQFGKWGNIYLGGQYTVNGLENDQLFLGGVFEVNNKYYLGFEERWGDIGEATTVNITKKETEKESNSLSFTQNRIGIGGSNFAIDFYRTYKESPLNELTFSSGIMVDDSGNRMTQTIRKSNYINEKLRWGIGYDNTSFEDNIVSSSVSREAANVWYWFKENEFKNKGKIEWREDLLMENIKSRVVYLEESIEFNVYGFNFSGKGGVGYAEYPEENIDRFDFTNIFAGLSYRPVYYPELNILGKYVYLTDLYPESRVNAFIEDSEYKKTIYTFGFVWDLCRWIEIKESIAFRNLEEKVGARDFQESEVYLWINGLTINTWKDIKITAEYRKLENLTFKDSESGYLLEILFPIKKVLYIGVGYNFTSFDDDLINEDEYDVKGPYLRLVGVY